MGGSDRIRDGADDVVELVYVKRIRLVLAHSRRSFQLGCETHVSAQTAQGLRLITRQIDTAPKPNHFGIRRKRRHDRAAAR